MPRFILLSYVTWRSWLVKYSIYVSRQKQVRFPTTAASAWIFPAQPDRGKRDNHYHSTYCTRIRHDPRHRLSSLVEAITIHPLSLSIDHYHRSSLSLMRAKLKLAKLKWTSDRQNGGDCGVHLGDLSRSRSGIMTLRELSQTSYEVFLYPHCTVLLTDTPGLASSSEIQCDIWGRHKYSNMGANSVTRKHSSTDANETADIGQGIDETLGR